MPLSIGLGEQKNDRSRAEEEDQEEARELPSGPKLGEEGVRLFPDRIQPLVKAIGLLLHEGDVDGVKERAEFRLGAKQLFVFLTRIDSLC
jgi:hypothetical protein